MVRILHADWPIRLAEIRHVQSSNTFGGYAVKSSVHGTIRTVETIVLRGHGGHILANANRLQVQTL